MPPQCWRCLRRYRHCCQSATRRRQVERRLLPTKGHRLRPVARLKWCPVHVDGRRAPGPQYEAAPSTKRRPVGPNNSDLVFRDRCHALLTGRWAPLLDIPRAARRLKFARNDAQLAKDVIALVREGEFSRAMTRADAAQLAEATETTIEVLRGLHPADDHALPPGAVQQPLSDLAPPPDPEGLSEDAFQEVFFRRLPRCSAADHGGWRYEYVSSLYRFGSSWRDGEPPGTPGAFIRGRGAHALYRLGCILYSGQLPACVRSWFLGGRLIALSKDGDKPNGDASQRKLRPIAIGSVIARAVSMVAAYQYRGRFAAYLQPPPPANGQLRLQPDGTPWPIQVGVACGSGLDFLVHTVQATLDKNPGWVDVALDCKNAFNSITRSAFMRVIAERFPGLWDWAYTLYGAPTELYVRRDGMPPEIIRSLCGTRQGCPLGAQFFCLGLHPLLLAIQSMLGDRGVVVAYCDDVHILTSPDVAAEIVPRLAARDAPAPPPAPAPLPAPVHLWSAGLELSRGKTTIYGPNLAAGGHVRVLTARTLRPCVVALGDPRHGSLEAQSAAMLRGDGSTVASGHPVLGTPVGTDAFVRDSVSSASARATRLIPILDRLLLADSAEGCYAPDERDTLLRFCVWPRLRHLVRTLPPGSAADLFRAFDDAVATARLAIVPSAATPGGHIDPVALAELPGRFGGHGVMPLEHRHGGAATHHDCA